MTRFFPSTGRTEKNYTLEHIQSVSDEAGGEKQLSGPHAAEAVRASRNSMSIQTKLVTAKRDQSFPSGASSRISDNRNVLIEWETGRIITR